MARALIIAGTRPEVIKLAPVIRELQKRGGPVTPVVCSTGQHREMLDQMMRFFGLKAEIDLDLMQPGQSPTDVAARAIARVGETMAKLAPDWVLVQGDTTTAMAASIAAFYARARVAHVEAGLRTANPYRPFPEEMNRRIIGRIASLHFPPTPGARDALLQEGVPADSVHMVGNTVIDALFETRDRAGRGEIRKPPSFDNLRDPTRVVLVTSHRRENFDQGIADICAALLAFATARPEWTIIFPVHPNPAIKGPVSRALSSVTNIRLTEPVDYGPFVAAMNAATFIVTDSGGVQEEGAALGKPIIVLREETERPEAIENGNAVLVGSDRVKIEREMTLLSDDSAARAKRSTPCAAYGDGKAAMRIADILERAS